MAGPVLKNFNMFLDGLNFAGKVTSVTPPELTMITEDYRGGGRDMAKKVELGMEPLVATFELPTDDGEVQKRFGWSQGDGVALVFRGAAQTDDGTTVAQNLTMRGRITAISRGTWSAGAIASQTVTMGLHYYQETVGDEVVIEIDVDNYKRIINGVDQLESVRAALGM